MTDPKPSPFRAIFGLSGAGLIVLLAAQGPAFFKALTNAWEFLLLISSNAPLGLASFFAALLAASIVWLALHRWVPEGRNRFSRSVLLDILSATAGAYVAWIQQPTNLGLLWGIMAGLVGALYGGRLAMAVATWIGNKLSDRDPSGTT